MASSEEYNITQEQTKMLIEANHNMISACEDYIRYRLNGDDEEYNNQKLSNKLQEKNKKEKILYDLITEISNSSNASYGYLVNKWGYYPVFIDNELNRIETLDYLAECGDEDPLDCLYGPFNDSDSEYIID